MADLYERLKFAIEIRLMVARAATPGPWEYAVVEGRAYIGRADTLPSVAEVEFEADVHHILATAPDDAVRRYEADLERLNEHIPKRTAMEKWAPQLDGLLVDWLCAGHGLQPPPWPCPEFSRLAAVYQIEVTG